MPVPSVKSILVTLLLCASAAAQQKADRIVIEKSQHRMTLFAGPNILRIYRIAIGRGPAGPKLQQGDNKTPEGDYIVDGHNAHSAAHMALRLSYPNAEDRARAAKAHVNPGGDIMIHGLPNGQGAVGSAHTATDWTYGCIAVTDEEVEEIYALVPNGAKVHIQP
jgi:murein L,D-transpeptidase YafK